MLAEKTDYLEDDQKGKMCVRCKTWKPFPELVKSGRYRNNRMRCCRQCHRISQAITREKYRLTTRLYKMKRNKEIQTEFLNAYGNKCSCCGENNRMFLTLEHLLGGGKKDRKGGSYHLFSRLKKEGWPKDKYTILCYNCNSGKWRNKGICPHEIKVNGEE